ncbi:hypothetical protein [Pseudomonas monteilii]|uniref:hypothetical protein n=1 Tax=Pseudomonas monteilii TaxID=76759 RepID=UPI001F323639|nr:hypothetical protein [Pseudomonas monteilii]
MTKVLAGLAAFLLALTVLAFWQSSRSEVRAQDLAEQLATSRFNERGAKLYADSLEQELEINEQALSLRETQYRRVAAELDKRKKSLMEIKDDACLDQPVPASLFGSVQHDKS